MIGISRRLIVSLLLGTVFAWGPPCAAAEYQQIPGVIHVHSDMSSGDADIDQLVDLARREGIGILVLTDHDLVTMQYGLPPLRNIVRVRKDRKSVLRAGPEKYLQAIRRNNERQKDVVVLAGVQSSPFYYWTGNPVTGSLTAHNYNRELLIVGLDSPEDYRGLPNMGGGGLTTAHLVQRLPRAIPGLLVLCAGMVLALLRRGRVRKAGFVLCVLGVALLVNFHPFSSSRFDPYHGDQGYAPFQATIDYVRDRGGLIYWAHPEARYGRKGVRMGPATLKTLPYPEALLETKNYTGFSVLYGDTITVTNPGFQWDQVLNAFVEGKRAEPVWGISGADFHGKPGDPGFDTYQTIFLVPEKTREAALEALARGRTYSVLARKQGRLCLDTFRVRSRNSGGGGAVLGETLRDEGPPVVEIRISSSDGKPHPVSGFLVRGGKKVREFQGDTPCEVVFNDVDKDAGETFYRIDASSPPLGRLVSNPIFVRELASRGE